MPAILSHNGHSAVCSLTVYVLLQLLLGGCLCPSGPLGRGLLAVLVALWLLGTTWPSTLILARWLDNVLQNGLRHNPGSAALLALVLGLADMLAV